jgi:hypothetical protein
VGWGYNHPPNHPTSGWFSKQPFFYYKKKPQRMYGRFFLVSVNIVLKKNGISISSGGVGGKKKSSILHSNRKQRKGASKF